MNAVVAGHELRVSLTTQLLSVLLLLLVTSPPPVYAVPRNARWSAKSLGPDGPWNALEITMGKGQTITTYPGKMWESFFLDSDYCSATVTKRANGKQQPCYAKQAGAIYNESAAGGILNVTDSPDRYFSGAMDSVAGAKSNAPVRFRDDFHLSRDKQSWAAGDTVADLDMVLLSGTQLKYPGGDSLPLFAGCLGLGAAPGAVNQTFHAQSGGDVNVSMVAGAYAKQGYTDTNSFGMHIGSALPHPNPTSPKKKMMEGSLWFGGYDKNRVIGEVLAIPIPHSNVIFDGLPLVDISINVGNGWRSKGGYLASGNSSIGSQIKMRLDGCHPYLNLPKSTCDALAADLPVTYQPALGLYVWNTESPAWPRIVSSASALTFTFLDPDNNAHRVNVSVPFVHLNLTLEAPLVEKPTPYFPCNAVTAGGDHWTLGRAFLQDAFFAASFDSATYFLAQAPGPNIASVDAANANTAVIGKTARTLAPSNNDWKTSWEGAAPGNGEGDASGSSDETHNAGLIAGLAVGIGGGVSLLALIGYVLYRRNRHGTGFACCGLRIVKDKEHAGGYGPATVTPGSPSPQLGEEQKEGGYKYPKYYNRHELPLNEAPSQLPDNQVPRPLTGSATESPDDVGTRKGVQPQGQVFEMAGDEYHERRQ
ncbi:aspartic peptidase domain-containing protein [Apiospora sp. TS-2023a]